MIEISITSQLTNLTYDVTINLDDIYSIVMCLILVLKMSDVVDVCRLRGRVKRHLHDYVGALEDLDAADRLEANDLDVLRYMTNSLSLQKC